LVEIDYVKLCILFYLYIHTSIFLIFNIYLIEIYVVVCCLSTYINLFTHFVVRPLVRPNLTEGPAATRDFRRSTKEEEEEDIFCRKKSFMYYVVHNRFQKNGLFAQCSI
jgi:hypothetical protein